MCERFGILFQKGVSCMYSPEFMKFLINYQKPEYDNSVNKQVKNFRFNPKNNKLASVLLLNKK